ncbi:hypothetical protein KAR91_71075 [Candidatus Pacearchaeota archaeon]|nr:hypothetical protein [Candidatus Pacearchaeota archaeon]
MLHKIKIIFLNKWVKLSTSPPKINQYVNFKFNDGSECKGYLNGNKEYMSIKENQPESLFCNTPIYWRRCKQNDGKTKESGNE